MKVSSQACQWILKASQNLPLNDSVEKLIIYWLIFTVAWCVLGQDVKNAPVFLQKIMTYLFDFPHGPKVTQMI